MSSDFDRAVNRLDQFEAQLRRQRRYVIGLTVLVLGQGVLLLYLLLPVGRLFGAPKSIEASHFVLVDGRGQVRGEWLDDSGPVLKLFSEQGQERAVVMVNYQGTASIVLLDNRPGGGRAAMLFANDDESGVDFRDLKGTQAGLMLSDKHPGLQKYGEPPRAGGPKP